MSSKLLDKYYTSSKIAKLCLNKINDYDLVLEPSAGSGFFSNLIKNKHLISVDIEPENENITKMDFLEENLELNSYKNVIVIGNPPFGKQNNLAIKFFNKCASYSHVNCIAMIFPKSFKKVSIHDRCDLNFKLIKTYNIPKNSFLFENEIYDVPCVFQIWKRCENPRKKSKMPKL